MIRGVIFPPNRSCYKARTFAAACKDLNLKPTRTKPCTPKTNGKASPPRPPRTGTAGRPTSRPRSGNGPMPAPPPSNAKTTCQNGPTGIIGTDRTAA